MLRCARADRTYSLIRRSYAFRFRVFELAPVAHQDEEYLGWAELDDDGLGGEVLFVGGSGSLALTPARRTRAASTSPTITSTSPPPRGGSSLAATSAGTPCGTGKSRSSMCRRRTAASRRQLGSTFPTDGNRPGIINWKYGCLVAAASLVY